MEENELERLARGWVGGDPECLRALVRGMSRKLVAMAYRYTREWEAARDLTQETWMRLLQKKSGYRREKPFQAWLLAVHRNNCLGHLRKAATRREVATDPTEIGKLRITGDGESDARLLEREFHDRIGEAMFRLTESQREVFALVDLEETPAADAARILEMNPATVRTTLHFARKRIAGFLRRMEESP